MARFIFVSAACFLMYPLVTCGAPPQEATVAAAREKRELINRALADYPRVANAVGEVLKSIPTDATTLSQAQLEALEAAGFYSNSTVERELVRLLMVKHDEQPWHERGIALRPQKLGRSDYPAANALCTHGPGGALAILDDVEKFRGKMDDQRLERYAEAIQFILRVHSIAFLKEERSHAPRSAIPLYDKLLATPVIRDSAVDYRRGEPGE